MMALCETLELPVYIMGNGSNLLVSDQGFRGVVVQVYKNLSHYEIKGTKVYAEAGILLAKLARHIYEAKFEGFEFASGIPGTLGGAVYMNAGAYGGEIKDVIIEATVLTREGVMKTLSKDELELEYRHSSLQANGDIVVSALMSFKEGEPHAIKTLMNDLNQKRRDKQPIELPSAGSTFKRPTGYFAGKLIMDAGLRGYQIGGARVSDKHCGFVVNMGDATCQDVLDLIDHVQKEVLAQFEVVLEPEVRIIGDF
jgi:UDP-N-acetylmuramate dehydrogenase